MNGLIGRAREFKGRPAILADGQYYSYERLLEASGTLAAELLVADRLTTNPPQPSTAPARIAFLLPPGFAYVATLWGVWQAGGVAVPLSMSATEAEIDYALADADPAVVLVAAGLQDRVGAPCTRLGIGVLTLGPEGEIREGPDRARLGPGSDRARERPLPDHGPKRPLPDHVREAAAQAPPFSPPPLGPDHPAMMLYTSGTTGKAKGVVTTHGNIQAQITSLVRAWEWRPDDRIPLFLPLHHVHGIVNVLSCALWSGAMVECFGAFDLERILARVGEGAYTVFMAVPTIYVKLIRALEGASAEARTRWAEGFGAMRLMVSGSAALPASVHGQWTRLTGQKLLERYGMTEIGMGLSNPLHGERRPGAVGRPLPGVEIRLVDDDGRIVAGEGRPGEIQVRGPGIFKEYWRRPDATAEAFVDGWFRTGDVALLDDGYYRILGRSSVDIIKSGGEKLSALEIEDVLRQHPAVKEVAVVGVEDPLWGEAVAAAVVPREGETLELDALREWGNRRLSKPKLPKRLVLVPDFPRNAMGKVMKPEVRALFR